MRRRDLSAFRSNLAGYEPQGVLRENFHYSFDLCIAQPSFASPYISPAVTIDPCLLFKPDASPTLIEKAYKAVFYHA